MGYLIAQITICLLIAALIGFVIGWLLRGIGCKKGEDYQQAIDVDSSEINTSFPLGAMPVADTASELEFSVQIMHHKIEKIEGIGSSLGNHLRNIGVKTTGDLIKKCSIERGFQQVVKATGAIDSVVSRWVSMAKLMQVPDVNGQFAELMEASGIKSVQDLALADANALTTKMQIVNQQEHEVPDSVALPEVSMVAHWIGDAKSIG